MTDYELYKLLEENGYATSDTNLQILKEGIKSGKIKLINEENNSDLKFLADDEKEAIEGYDKIIDKVEDKHLKDQLEHIKQEEKNHLEYLEKAQNDKDAEYEDEHELTESIMTKEAKKEVTKAKEWYKGAKFRAKLAKKSNDPKLAQTMNDQYKDAKQKVVDAKTNLKQVKKLNENLSDYELYKLLEENNFKPTKQNLYILKEGIIEGEIEIEE